MSRRMAKLHIPGRVSALALALLLMLGVLPVRAAALTGTTGSLNWSLSGGTLSITGSGPMPDYSDANMPPWYDSADAINRVRVEEGVTSIGDLAFYNCRSVKAVSLPGTITAIGDRAFKDCRRMTWLNLPEGLCSIGEAAFESCEAMSGILLPQSLRTVGDYAFDRCVGLRAITIPAGVESLGRVAFSYCTGLTQATILCPVEKVPDWLFYGCTALSVVKLPDTVTRVGERTFQNCRNLTVVYYAGPAVEDISAALQAEESTRLTYVSTENQEGLSSAGSFYDEQTATSTTVSVKETGAAQVTTTTKTQYTYTVNGETADRKQVLSAGEGDTVTADEVSSSTTISATVSGSGGWQEVSDAALDAASRRESGGVQVEVQLDGSVVAGEDIAALAANADTKLTISTGDGCTWVIDSGEQMTEHLKKETYDLAFQVELLEKSPGGMESDNVYRLEFPSDVELRATVGVPLKMDDAGHTASLYEKTGGGLTALATVRVDGEGKAWLPVSGVSAKRTYYIAIDAAGIDRQEVLLPASMLEESGVEYVQTLTDASGRQYIVGQRTSRWGITGGQFALYAALAIGGVVLIVGGVMFTLNKIGRTKARYAAMAAEDAARAEIDEEELRIQVMRELLEEAKGKNDEDRSG